WGMRIATSRPGARMRQGSTVRTGEDGSGKGAARGRQRRRGWGEPFPEHSFFPYELTRRIAEAGLNGIGIPEEDGGQGGDLIDQVIVCEELSRSLAGLAWAWGVTVWSGAKAVSTFGTDEQKKALLPSIAKGETRFAFALTEPGGGTDVLRAMRTRAARVDGGFVLNGTKIWSTMSNTADRIMVVARTSDADKPSRGLTAFLVRGGSPGLTARPIPKLGMR